MNPQGAKASVFMVRNCELKDGVPQIPAFLEHKIEYLRNAGVEEFIGVVDDRTSIRGILRNIRRLKSEIIRYQPGLVHAEYGSITAAIACFIKGQVPLVVSFCGDDILGTPNPGLVWRVRERLARAIGLWAARRATAIVVKSNNLLQALPETIRSRATILPEGVNLNLFKPMPRDACRARLGWSMRKVVLFNAGYKGNQKVKNLDLARETLHRLTESFPDALLKTVSDASSEDVRLLLNAADCLLVTSFHEGSPNIVKEAMACNLPVVSVPCGDVTERLAKTYPGGVYPYDASALAEAIGEVFRAGRRSNGRDQIVAQGMTTAGVAARLIELYEEVQAIRSQGTLKQRCAV
jgi:glycosyltransferase involved in cell wall biosynthesis